MVRVIKKEEDFIPFQQTFVNAYGTKKEEIHNVSDFSETDPLNTNNFKPNSSGRKKKHFCSRCSASYRNKKELTDHIKSIHKGLRPYNCSICDSKFSYKKNLKYHEKAVHEIGKSYLKSESNGFQCRQCSDCFFQKSRLIQHMNEFHSNGLEKKLRCVTCDIGFNNDSELNEHMSTKHLEIANRTYARISKIGRSRVPNPRQGKKVLPDN